VWGWGDLLLVEGEAVGYATKIEGRRGSVHSEELEGLEELKMERRKGSIFLCGCASEDTDGCGECHAAIYWPRPTCAATSRLLFASC
jgi:hypothetical protein